LTVTAAASSDIRDELEWTAQKGELFNEVFNQKLAIRKA
jgi:hypothetical protein